ncbi:hypothetical protein BD410DRAFT_801771 [Rickenella mellea]|uniref:Uncharacterized protein n=1 Tax=Rickenella mellea TaxID=50990 RepID=A0A4Y7QDY1_9AGAM|nr:hypothetical protein BD410DRAFT_801771 [Rickenella mellea]
MSEVPNFPLSAVKAYREFTTTQLFPPIMASLNHDPYFSLETPEEWVSERAFRLFDHIRRDFKRVKRVQFEGPGSFGRILPLNIIAHPYFELGNAGAWAQPKPFHVYWDLNSGESDRISPHSQSLGSNAPNSATIEQDTCLSSPLPPSSPPMTSSTRSNLTFKEDFDPARSDDKFPPQKVEPQSPMLLLTNPPSIPLVSSTSQSNSRFSADWNISDDDSPPLKTEPQSSMPPPTRATASSPIIISSDSDGSIPLNVLSRKRTAGSAKRKCAISSSDVSDGEDCIVALVEHSDQRRDKGGKGKRKASRTMNSSDASACEDFASGSPHPVIRLHTSPYDLWVAQVESQNFPQNDDPDLFPRISNQDLPVYLAGQFLHPSPQLGQSLEGLTLRLNTSASGSGSGLVSHGSRYTCDFTDPWEQIQVIILKKSLGLDLCGPQTSGAEVRETVHNRCIHMKRETNCLNFQHKDQESWKGTTGHAPGNSKVFCLGDDPGECASVGVQCWQAKLRCNGLCVCEFFDENILKDCERYEPNVEEMQERWQLELDANPIVSLVLTKERIRFYQRAIAAKCRLPTCTGQPVVRALSESKAPSQDGKYHFVSCSEFGGDTYDHIYIPIPSNVDERQFLHLIHTSLMGRYKSEVLSNENLIRKAVVILSNAHNHPIHPKSKPTFDEKEHFKEAVDVGGRLAPSTSAVYDGKSMAESSPAYFNKRLVRDAIRDVKLVEYPNGMDWEGVVCEHAKELKLPPDERYIQAVVTKGDFRIVVVMLPRLAVLVHDASYLVIDFTFKRVRGTMNEWEIVIFSDIPSLVCSAIAALVKLFVKYELPKDVPAGDIARLKSILRLNTQAEIDDWHTFCRNSPFTSVQTNKVIIARLVYLSGQVNFEKNCDLDLWETSPDPDPDALVFSLSWDLTPGHSNLVETAHAARNAETSIQVPILTAILELSKETRCRAGALTASRSRPQHPTITTNKVANLLRKVATPTIERDADALTNSVLTLSRTCLQETSHLFSDIEKANKIVLMNKECILPNRWNGPKHREIHNQQRRAWGAEKKHLREADKAEYLELTTLLDQLKQEKTASMQRTRDLKPCIDVLKAINAGVQTASEEEELRLANRELTEQLDRRRELTQRIKELTDKSKAMKDLDLNGVRLNGGRPARTTASTVGTTSSSGIADVVNDENITYSDNLQVQSQPQPLTDNPIDPSFDESETDYNHIRHYTGVYEFDVNQAYDLMPPDTMFSEPYDSLMDSEAMQAAFSAATFHPSEFNGNFFPSFDSNPGY